MNKKAQIYIIAALIIIAVFFGLMSRSNIFIEKETTQEFNDISNNYAVESNIFLNSLISENIQDVPSAFSNFTFLFTAYSKSKNPGFGLIYAFEYGNQLHIGNYLNRPITIVHGGTMNNLNGCYEKIPSSIAFEGLTIQVDPSVLGTLEDCTINKSAETNQITVVIGGIPYEFKIEEDHPQLVIVSRMDKEEQRRVFIEGETLAAGAYSKAAELTCCNQGINTPGCIGNRVNCEEIYKFSPLGCEQSPQCILKDQGKCEPNQESPCPV